MEAGVPVAESALMMTGDPALLVHSSVLAGAPPAVESADAGAASEDAEAKILAAIAQWQANGLAYIDALHEDLSLPRANVKRKIARYIDESGALADKLAKTCKQQHASSASPNGLWKKRISEMLEGSGLEPIRATVELYCGLCQPYGMTAADCRDVVDAVAKFVDGGDGGGSGSGGSAENQNAEDRARRIRLVQDRGSNFECVTAAVKKLKRSTCSVEDCKAAFLARLNEDLKAVATPSPAKASGYIILSTEELVVSDEDDDDVIVELEARQSSE